MNPKRSVQEVEDGSLRPGRQKHARLEHRDGQRSAARVCLLSAAKHQESLRGGSAQDASASRADITISEPGASSLRASASVAHPSLSVVEITARRSAFLRPLTGPKTFPSQEPSSGTWDIHQIGEMYGAEASERSIETWGIHKFIVNDNGDSVLLLTAERHPLRPNTHGSHGVFFDTPEHHSLYRSLVLTQNGRPFAVFSAQADQCTYLGHYRVIPSVELSYVEWRCLPEQTKYCWFDIANGRKTWLRSIRSYLHQGSGSPVSFSGLQESMRVEGSRRLCCWALEFQEYQQELVTSIKPAPAALRPEHNAHSVHPPLNPSGNSEKPMESVVPHGATIDSTAPIRLDAVLPTSTNGSSRRGFSRLRISKIFGGGRQATISSPSEEKVILNNTSNLCIQPDWNPWGPSQPGKHGVLFLPPEGMFKDVPSPEPNGATLFCWNGMNNWIYLGQYRACRAAALSPDEWDALDETTKTIWFRKAKLMKQWRDAINMLTPGRIDDKITKDTFNAAMSLGVTKLDCWTLEFIHYRHDYFRVLAGEITVEEAEAN